MSSIVIPKGIYCYDENGICPYWRIKHLVNSDGIKIKYYHCIFLKENDCGNNDNICELLHQYFHHNDQEFNRFFTLSLLWDQCKECNENMDIEND